MARFQCSFVAFTFAAFLAVGGTAAADPIQITSGFIQMDASRDVHTIESISFGFSTATFRFAGSDPEGPLQDIFRPVLAVFNGFVSFTPVGGTPVRANGARGLVFTALPAPTPTPFQASGNLLITEFSSGAVLFNDMLSGAGTASWRFKNDPSGSRFLTGVTYTFADVAQTPEPAAWLLLVTGLGTLVARVRSQRAS